MHRFARFFCLSILLFGITLFSSSAINASGRSNSVFLPILTGGGGSGTGPIFGNGSDLVAAAIPTTVYQPAETDFSTTHPDLTGINISHNTLIVAFELGTTVDEANEIINEIDGTIVGGLPGVNTQAPGILFVKTPSTSHAELIATIAALDANAKIRNVVQDIVLETNEIPAANGGNPANWTWNSTPAGGNWGFERIGVPQMWNLNAAIEKAGTTTDVGVLDVGFIDSHPDLNYAQNLTPGQVHDHGTHVAGTIGATYNNSVGVDGVNPFSDLYIKTLDGIPANDGTAFGWRSSAGTILVKGIFDLMRAQPEIKVVNVSLGYNWYKSNIDSDTSARAQRIANQHGSLMGLAQLIWVIQGNELPIIVAAAGNDSNAGFGLQDAKYLSPYTNAAIEYDMANIIVVESLQNDTGTGGATRSLFSGINGFISAPGSGILSTSILPGGYVAKNGTSMAAPHVTGLVSYLYSVDPDLPRATLTTNPILDILQANDVPVGGGASNRVDAFASVMQLDSFNANDDVRRMLTDIDDGTADGNQRTLSGTSIAYNSEDADADGGIGDGNVDMSDFRRWRDWYLLIEDDTTLDLDGSPGHLKKDVNGNGFIDAPPVEGIFPRGDFNGDGVLDLGTAVRVPGRFPMNLTDLGVLQSVFSDDNYNAGDLTSLVYSGDVTIQPFSCFPDTDADVVRSRVYGGNANVNAPWREHANSNHKQVYTLPANDFYMLEMVAYDAVGNQTHSATGSVVPGLGSDFWWDPDCEEITDNPPSITIINPAADHSGSSDGFMYDGYDSSLSLHYSDVVLMATASDTEDGTLSGSSIVWTTDRSDIQGSSLGTGSPLTTRMYSDDCFGAWHTVTATVTDSDGNTAFATREIFLWTLC